MKSEEDAKKEGGSIRDVRLPLTSKSEYKNDPSQHRLFQTEDPKSVHDGYDSG